MGRLLFVLALALSAISGMAAVARADGPVDVITKIYDGYQKAESTVGVPAPQRVYSRRLQGLIDKDRQETPQGEVGRLDWDVFVDGNDWKLTDLSISSVEESAERATVRATFKNFGEARDILFTLVKEDGSWLIDEVQSTTVGGRWTMSKILTGAPDAFPDEPPPDGAADDAKSASPGAELPPGEGMAQ